jgi:outer membrane receptor protein involved in Fe transport
LNVSATFTQEIGPGKFQFTAEENYTSSYTNDYQGAPAGFAYPGIPGVLPAGTTTTQVLALYRTPGYAVTNLNASYTVGPVQISAYVRNLTNKQYIAAVLGFDAVNYPQEVPGEPRTMGVAVKYSF